MGKFSDLIAKAETTESGKYLKPGLFVVDIQRIKKGETRKGMPNFIVECRVVETNNAADHPVDSSFTWYVDLTKDAAAGNIKAFLKAAFAKNEIAADDVDSALSDDCPLIGKRVVVEAFNITTAAGKAFTKTKWEVFPDA